MYNYGGCYQQPCVQPCGGNSCGIAIILVLFILLVVAGCGCNNFGCGC